MTVQSGQYSTSLINQAFADQEAEFLKVLYRDNPTGRDNSMQNDLDMNSQRILNLPNAIQASEPVTYSQLTGLVDTAEITGTVLQEFTATAGQTAFTLTITTYTPGGNNLAVYVNGVRQHTFVEDSSGTTFTLSGGADAGDKVLAVVNERVTGTATTAASNVTYTRSDTGAVTQNAQTVLQNLVATPEDFGAIGNGTTDDTDAVQAAIDTGACRLLPEKTYLCTTLTITDDVEIFGAGWSSAIKQADSQSGNLITVTGNNLSVFLHDFAIDGNQINQGTEPSQYSLRVNAASGTLTTPRHVVLRGMHFMNGCNSDVFYRGNSVEDTQETLTIEGCRFSGGAPANCANLYAPRFVQISDSVNIKIHGNWFDTGYTTAPAYGKAGITHSLSTSGLKIRSSVTDNEFLYCGISSNQAGAGTLGSIDLYTEGEESIIAGNRVRNSYGRGIAIKADSRNILIYGNIVSDTSAGTADSVVAADILMTDSTTTNAYESALIQGNICTRSGNRGILVEGDNSTNTDNYNKVKIVGNIVDDCADIGIRVGNVDEAEVLQNTIKGAGAQAISFVSCTSYCKISGNSIYNSTGTGLAFSSGNGTAEFHITDNLFKDIGGDAMDGTSDQCTVVGNTFDTVTGVLFDITDTPVVLIDGNASKDTTGNIHSIARSGACIPGSNNFDKAVNSLTVRVPDEYSTLQEALDSLGSTGGPVTINIESGHEPTAGISLSNGDWSRFTITSTDAEVTVDSGFTGKFLLAENARAPTLDTVIDMDSTGDDGVWIAQQSSIVIESGAGIKNSNGRGLYVGSGSGAKAEGSTWDGCGQSGDSTDRTIFVTRTSRCSLQDATVANSQSTDAAVYISRNSQVFAAGITISDSAGHATWCHRGSEYVAQSSTVTDCAKNGVFAQRSSTVDVNGSTWTGIGEFGIENIGGVTCAEGCDFTAAGSNTDAGIKISGGGIADVRNITLADFDEGIWAKGASTVSAANCDITDSTTRGVLAEQGSRVDVDAGSVVDSGTDDLQALTGSQIFADSCTTTAGSPAVADCNVSSFNAIDSDNGIIWD